MNLSKIGISAIHTVLPGSPVSSEDIAQKCGSDPAFIRDKIGIEFRHFAGAEEYVSDLSYAAGKGLIEASGVDPETIGLLVVVTQTPDYCLPGTASIVHGRLGLPDRVAAFDLNMGCSGYVYGLATAVSLMEAQQIDQGLLITAETYSKLMASDDKNTFPIFGDGATATLLTNRPDLRVARCTFASDGNQWDKLVAKGSAVRRDDEAPLFMDGRGIYTFVMSSVPSTIDRCLEINGLSFDDIDLWLFHQANKYILENLAECLKIPPEKTIIDLEKTGNTTSSSIPIIIEKYVLNKAIRPKNMVLCGFGTGLSVATTILQSTGKKGTD